MHGSRALRVLLATALTTALVGVIGVAPSRAAEPPPLTATQLDRLTPATSTTTFSSTPAVRVGLSTGSGINTIGTTCSGWSKNSYASKVVKNSFGEEIFRYTMRATWCFNGIRITYVTTARYAQVKDWALVGGWRFAGEIPGSYQEGFYIYNAHTNGGAVLRTQGKFEFSPIRIGYLFYGVATVNMHLHYNASWNYSASWWQP